MEGSSNSNTFAGFQHEINENMIDVPFPTMANAMPAAEHGVPNPNGDGLFMDPNAIARKREMNRKYSQTYRLKKIAHIQNLEERKNNLMQIISQEAPLTQSYMETGSVLQTERNELQETLSNLTTKEEAQRAELKRLMNELEQLKKTKEANDAKMARRMDFLGI
ncbi:hypothetical protein TSUD_126140 [Trifolium subterraneum]|uniref:BZIP domain-containing protein n=1 Tax=Trifolium subterraneum TaxID=3900 RepID=A0A2Z6M888_TRISU|nr:hypothetical protein TSUD_126140 [Trifolium subterraneum]